MTFKPSDQLIMTFKPSDQLIMTFKPSDQLIMTFKPSGQLIVTFKPTWRDSTEQRDYSVFSVCCDNGCLCLPTWCMFPAGLSGVTRVTFNRSVRQRDTKRPQHCYHIVYTKRRAPAALIPYRVHVHTTIINIPTEPEAADMATRQHWAYLLWIRNSWELLAFLFSLYLYIILRILAILVLLAHLTKWADVTMDVVVVIAVCGLLSWPQFYVVMLPDRIHVIWNELNPCPSSYGWVMGPPGPTPWT